MQILGIDYGTKRIGLATGDSASALVFPLRSIPGGALNEVVAAILDAARAENAQRIVVGVPRRMNNDKAQAPGETERQALALVEAIKVRTALAVDTEDERMTTALAERWRKMSGKKKPQFDKDAGAAAAILESYIMRKGADVGRTD